MSVHPGRRRRHTRQVPKQDETTKTDRTRADLDLVVVTGTSGGGRSTVAKALENVGFYVVDNLPEALMVTMAELAYESGDPTRRTAMVLDVRSRAFTADLVAAVAELRKRGFKPRVVFVDAEDDVLVRRYEKVRRAHPLQGAGRILDGIAAEREILAAARETADALIDTSHLNENQLRARVEELFAPADSRRVRITTLSFGFKYGIPLDADFVVDVRFLPNPYWIPELREHTGTDAEVSEYVLQQPGAEDFVSRYAGLVADTTPGFEREGKRYVTVAVGCTGGKHRSVAIAEALAASLRQAGLSAYPHHRDMGLE